MKKKQTERTVKSYVSLAISHPTPNDTFTKQKHSKLAQAWLSKKSKQT